jgi:hypothetical protein
VVEENFTQRHGEAKDAEVVVRELRIFIRDKLHSQSIFYVGVVRIDCPATYGCIAYNATPKRASTNASHPEPDRLSAPRLKRSLWIARGSSQVKFTDVPKISV